MMGKFQLYVNKVVEFVRLIQLIIYNTTILNYRTDKQNKVSRYEGKEFNNGKVKLRIEKLKES